MLVYVARHGESEDDLTQSYGGASDFALTPDGREQARLIGRRLKSVPIEAIYSSPLRRASESARLINEQIGGVPLEIIPELRERNTYGVISGHTPERARELFGYIIDQMEVPPGKGRECVPGGEEYPNFLERVRQAWNAVMAAADSSGYSNVLVVTHGKFTLGLFSEVLRVGADYNRELGAINVIEWSKPVLRQFADA